MDGPSAARDSHKITVRSSVIESLGACGLSGLRIDKEELKQKLMMPQYLRMAMRDCIRLEDPTAGESSFISSRSDGDGNVKPPEMPMVIFINRKSGGRLGPVLKERLQYLMGEEQVFDLSDVKPHEFVKYGLGCLEMLAGLGDSCAKECRERIRVMVAGGDGTVGWVLGCLTELHREGRLPVPPVGIVPLGTGNDLSRSFGWGGSFPYAWKSAIKRSLYRASTGAIHRLDSWRVSLSMPDGTSLKAPYSLKPTEELNFDEGLEVEGKLPEKAKCHEGVFYNYFSIGMDAQVAHGFHHLREEKPYLANGPIANKIIYSGYSCTQGWFFTPCTSSPSLRGLNNILRMHIKEANCSDWKKVTVPSSVRAIVALNLHSYGSGRNPWGKPKPEYLEKRRFVEAHVDDGLLEIFGLKQGWHASFVMFELISAKHIAQLVDLTLNTFETIIDYLDGRHCGAGLNWVCDDAAAVRLELIGGEWEKAYMQMDGEPWKQPLNKNLSTVLEIKREPYQSHMIRGD